MIKRLLPFMNHNENSFVQFLEETKHLEPRVVNTKTSIILESYDTRLGTSEKNHEGNEGVGSVMNISNSKKSNKSNGKEKEKNLVNKCNIYNSSNSKKKHCHWNDDVNYLSFGNLKEKMNIENSLITTNTKKQSLFGENPLEVYRLYNNEIKLNNSMSRVKEATEMLNKIIENIKVIPILCLKEDRKKDKENKEKNRKNRKEKEESEEEDSIDDNKNLKYKCEYCDKYFNSASSKGGHIRSHHPGKSEKYKKKIAKANERASIRELNKEAQKIYLIKIKNQYNNDKRLSKQVEIKKIKDELLKKGKGCEEN